MSVREKLCLSKSVCVCQSQSVCHRQYVSVTDGLFLSHNVYVCDRQLLSVSENLCLSEKNISVTYIMCLSQTVCVFPRQSVFVTVPLSLSQIIRLCHKKFCLSVLVFMKHSSWHYFYFLIHDFHLGLPVRF